MPMRGRDTYYLESWMAVSCIVMGIMVIATDYNAHTRYVRLVGDFLIPTTLWASTWFVAGLVMGYGTLRGQRKYLEWGALMSFALWAFLSYRSLINYNLFPQSAFLSPVNAVYAAILYFYQRKISLYVKRNEELATIGPGHTVA